MEFEESDFIKAQEIEQMLSGKFVCRKCSAENENRAWLTMSGYYASQRLAIEELGKAHARTRAKREICSNDFSILDGFDMAISLAEKVVLQAKMLMELQEKKEKLEEVNHGADEQYD